jgi:hypothetical protein
MKVPVVIRDDYTMFLEFFDGMLWFHTDVRKWTQEVKVKYLEDLNILQYLINCPLVAMVNQRDKKLSKFGKVIGFKYEQPFLGNDKQMYDIYSRSK